MTAAKELHRILPYLRLVILYPAYLATVGCKHHRTVGGELFLIHPVGHSVDYLIKLAVLCHLALRIVIQQFHEVYVVLPDKGYLCAVGREHGCLLLTAVGQCHHLVVAHVEDVVGCRERAPVYGLRVCLDEDVASVGTYDISVDTVDAYLRTSHIVEVEHCTHLFAGLEGELEYFPPVL